MGICQAPLYPIPVQMLRAAGAETEPLLIYIYVKQANF
jgi:hypothetical protein